MDIDIKRYSLHFNFNFKTVSDKKYFRKEFHYLIINTALLLIGGVERNPGPKCVYKDCEIISAGSSNLKIKHHQFKIARRERWLLNCGHDKNSPLAALSDEELVKKFVCSKHFLKENYRTMSRTRLLDDIDPIPYESIKTSNDSTQNQILENNEDNITNKINEQETNLGDIIELPCLFCDFRGEVTSVYEHISTSHNYCRICNILFQSEPVFHEHVKNHAGGLIYFNQCNFCLDGFRETTDVESHLISQHSKLLFKNCYETGKLYLDRAYKKVIRSIPKEKMTKIRNTGQCPYCLKHITKIASISIAITWEQHLSKKHSIIKCEHCNVFFKIQDIIDNGLCNFCLQLPSKFNQDFPDKNSFGNFVIETPLNIKCEEVDMIQDIKCEKIDKEMLETI